MESTVGGSRTAARPSLFLIRVLAPDAGRRQPTQQHGPSQTRCRSSFLAQADWEKRAIASCLNWARVLAGL